MVNDVGNTAKKASQQPPGARKLRKQISAARKRMEQDKLTIEALQKQLELVSPKVISNSGTKEG
jgi:hypothetical protein